MGASWRLEGGKVLTPLEGGGGEGALTHMTVLPTPAWGALALLWPDTNASVQTGLGTDRCGCRRVVQNRTARLSSSLCPQAWEYPVSPSSQVSAPGCRFFQPWQHTTWVCCTSLLTSLHATWYVVLEHRPGSEHWFMGFGLGS